MDQGLYASWIGTAMTALTAATGFAAYLFPEYRLAFAVGAVLFLLIALHSFWRAIQVRREALPLHRQQPVSGTIKPARRRLGAFRTILSVKPVLQDGSALLRITNEGRANLKDVVARLFSAGTESHGQWSKEHGDRFVPGGGFAADLKVGHPRLVLIAQVVEGTWRCGGDATKAEISGNNVKLGVNFMADGLSQLEYLQLGFDSERRPTISFQNR